MAGTAGYNYEISVSTTASGTYNEIPSSSGSFNRTSDVLDDTDTTNAGFHSRILGLLDSACNAESNWNHNDLALVAIESAYENRTALFVKVLPDGVAGNGKKFPVVVENFNISLDVTGTVTASISFQGNGAVTADNV